MIREYFKEAFVEAGGFRMRYVEGGSGHPIVCLHGGDELHLSPAYEALAQSFRVIAFEKPEKRRSVSIEDFARSAPYSISYQAMEETTQSSTWSDTC